jgi:hypothetical protein
VVVSGVDKPKKARKAISLATKLEIIKWGLKEDNDRKTRVQPW